MATLVYDYKKASVLIALYMAMGVHTNKNGEIIENDWL